MKNRLIGMLAFLTLSPVLTFAHGFGWDEGGGNHMGFMGGGWGNHMGFMGGGWMMIFWMVLLGLLIATAVKWIFFSRNKPEVSGNALNILTERYAKGELSQEEYQKMKKELR